MRLLKILSVILAPCLLAPCALVALAEAPHKVSKWNFEDAALGQLPKGWSAAQTGDGKGSVWKVVEDATAPQGSKVLAQTAESTSVLFNLCVADDTEFKDVEVSVSFKAVQGKSDQGGGLVWRYQDANNYYVARFNPLEDNFRLYKVVAGKRVQLESKEGLKAASGAWHTMSVSMQGNQIECSLNGETYLEVLDDTFTKPGRVGLWTKADAQSEFDDFQIAAAQ